MKYTLFLTVFLLPLCVYSQFKISGYGTQQIGVEHNPLNNPSSLVTGSEEEGEEIFELTPSPILSFSKVYIHARQKGKQTTFGLRPKLTYRYYHELKEANQLRGSVEQYFNFRINKKWKLYEDFSVSTNLRNGEALDEDIFSIPRSYLRWRAGLGSIYKFSKEWSLEIGANFLKNNYQVEEDKINYYQAVAGIGKVKRKFNKSNSLRQLEMSIEWQQRNWFRGSENEEGEWTGSVTQMNYWNMSWSGSFYLNENWKWAPFLKLVGRKSEKATQNWQSLRAGFSTSWIKDDFKIEWMTNASNKIHPALKPAGKERLKYYYFRNNLTAEYNFQKKWSALLTVQNTQRLSNFKDPSKRANRAYKNLYVGVGVKVRF